MRDHLRRLFDYDDWANRAELEHLRGLRDAPRRAIDLLAHIAAAQWVWYSRLRGETSPVLVWPSFTLEECAFHLTELPRLWDPVLDGADFDKEIDYTNSKGEQWTSRIGEVLTHLVLHGAYHRGQIALVVRGAGETPAYTDFIECTRRGWI